MKLLSFTSRTTKEIIRDPINVFFGLFFPSIILVILGIINIHIPTQPNGESVNTAFMINNLAPSIAIFSLSFLTIFSATLLSRDRETALLERLFTTPLTSFDFLMGYILPLIPIAVIQSIICFAIAFAFGLTFSISLIYALLMIIPISLFFIVIGLFFGSILGVKQVGGICGALLTNLNAFLSGTFFDLALLGNVFKKIANFLPFVHCVELERAVANANYGNIWVHLLWVIGYSIVFLVISSIIFVKKMRK